MRLLFTSTAASARAFQRRARRSRAKCASSEGENARAASAMDTLDDDGLLADRAWRAARHADALEHLGAVVARASKGARRIAAASTASRARPGARAAADLWSKIDVLAAQAASGAWTREATGSGALARAVWMRVVPISRAEAEAMGVEGRCDLCKLLRRRAHAPKTCRRHTCVPPT